MKSDDHLFVLTTLPNRYRTYSASAEAFEENGNVTIYRFPVREHASGLLDQSLSFLDYARQSVKVAKTLETDIVVATTSRLMSGILGAYVSARNGSKYYLDIRDIFSETISEMFSRKSRLLAKLLASLFSVLEKYAINRASKINVVSEGFKDYFSLKGFDTSAWSFFPNGVDEIFVGQHRDRRKTSKERKKVVYAGNIGAGQGLSAILPDCAVRVSKTHEFLVIGDGGERNELRRAIDAKGVENIELIPPVAREELVRRYLEADILFLHLNDFKAFQRVLPSKIFEYVAMGRPIVAGVAGYAAKFLRSNAPQAYVFEPGDVAGCVQALLRAGDCEVLAQPVDEFVSLYSRRSISRAMANEIYGLH
jgi:hypothetical protein